MNISSIVVKVLPENAEKLIGQFKESDVCEFHLYENGNIIVTIEGDSADEEIQKLKQIERISGVISAQMIYTYCEVELESEKEKLQDSQPFPDWLNDENLKAEDVPRYYGDVKSRF